MKNFQTMIGVAATGAADPVTRWRLAESAATPAVISHATIGTGGTNGCQVAVVGDSLMAGAEALRSVRSPASAAPRRSMARAGGRSRTAGNAASSAMAAGR